MSDLEPSTGTGRPTGPDQRGRTRIAPRALDRVVSAVTADAFGVSQKSVSLDIDDAGGDLSLRVRTPLPIPSLDRIHDDPSIVDRTGGPIVERTTRAQESIRSRVQSITGSSVARVLVEITGAEPQKERRVR